MARSTARGLGWDEPLALTVLALSLFAALPPLAALYARGVLLRGPLGRRDLAHALAPLATTATLTAVLIARGDFSLAVWQSYGIALQLLALGYGAWVVRLWRSSERPRWAGGVLAAFGVHWAFSAGAWAASLVPGVPAPWGPAMEGLSMAALVAFGGAALVTALRAAPALAPEPPAPYARAGLGTSERQRLTERLRDIIERRKPHLDPDLSASDLADLIGATPRELSEVLTCEVGESFFEFLAGLRVEEAKRRLADPARADETILEVIYASGFNSKSAFHRAFRERVGQTPSAFRRAALERARPRQAA